MKDYYVILTGSKNNAGDFLIKHRAKKLFSALRGDREIVDLNAWIPFDDKSLAVVNSSKALILTGGPALQKNMYPRIYAMTPNLDAILAPITAMGIGWKSSAGDWIDTYDYPLSEQSTELIGRMGSSDIPISVRDYHTLNVMARKGVKNVRMTGCPAYYDLDSIGVDVKVSQSPAKVAFSLGVSFIDSPSMEQQMKMLALQLRDYFKDSEFEVAFHHSLDAGLFLTTHGASKVHVQRHNQFAQWLKEEGIAYRDISGSAESLIDYYDSVDLHVGYRVHAHIFMSSVSKPSVLIAEDGRGKATEKVIGGVVMHGYSNFKSDLFSKVMNKIFHRYDRYSADRRVAGDVIRQIEYELIIGGQRTRGTRKAIDMNFGFMRNYIESLP